MINLSNGSFRNIPAEVYEVKHPMKVEEFSIRTDSGGPGRWRGGCGVVRAYRLYEDSNVSLWFERSKTPAWGIHGGKAGRPPENSIEGPQVRSSPLKLKAHTFPAGTLVTTRTGGGGGYGEARKRPPEAVLADVINGYVSVEGAAHDYGVVIDRKAGTIDAEATAKLRAAE
jgi:N-methylhydantoinase B